MMNAAKRLEREVEIPNVPISSQGQVTIPKVVREHLGIAASQGRVTFVIRMDGTIVVERVPTVDELFGSLRPNEQVKPANVNESREEMVNERLRELGYPSKND